MFRTLVAIHGLFGTTMAAVAVVSAYVLGHAAVLELAAAASLAVILVTPLSVAVWREVTEFHQVTRRELGQARTPLPVFARD